MLNFTVGPVQSADAVRAIGAQDVPYFRTPEFSAVMLESERIYLELLHAPASSRAVFVTGSGTAGMEAAIMNVFSREDKVLVVDGGGFGHRFVELCALHEVPHTAIELERCTPLTASDLAPFEDAGYTGFVVNIHETSTGVLYDHGLIADFCRRNGLFLVVDAISSFLADPLDMTELGADVVIAGSQKALACPPGVAPIALSPAAVERVERHPMRCMYLDLGLMLTNGERGQTPFTPAVGTLLQINARLREAQAEGVKAEVARTAALAADFRSRARELPLEQRLAAPSNAVTYLATGALSAKRIVATLKDEYGIWVCPNGGPDADSSFRVGHIGKLTMADNALLVAALREVCARVS